MTSDSIANNELGEAKTSTHECLLKGYQEVSRKHMRTRGHIACGREPWTKGLSRTALAQRITRWIKYSILAVESNIGPVKKHATESIVSVHIDIASMTIHQVYLVFLC